MEKFIEAIWKSAAVFFILMILTRIIGRKLLSQMSFFDYVVAVTIGTIGGAYVVQEVKDEWVLISPVILTLLTIGFGYANIKSLRLRRLTEGEPVVIIQNGKILEKNMRKLRYHLGDMEVQLRDKGIFNLGDVEFAILEPHGQLSVLKKSQKQPVTPHDLRISTDYAGIASEIIKDGKVIEQNLIQNNLTEEWLNKELKSLGICDYSEVMYAALNTDGTLYIDKKDDKLEYIQKVED